MPYRNSTFTLYIDNPPTTVEYPYRERTFEGFEMVSIVPGRVELSRPLRHSQDVAVGWRARVVQFPNNSNTGQQLFTGRITSITTGDGQQTFIVEQQQDPRTAACVICGQRGCRHTHAELSGHQHQPTGPSDEENWLTRARAAIGERPYVPYAGGSSPEARRQHYQDAVTNMTSPYVPLRDPNPMMGRTARDLVAPLRGMAQYAVIQDDDMKLELDREERQRGWDRELNDPKPTPRTAWQRLLVDDEDEDPSV